ncbi:MAG: SulP family inorganic anion transporter [Planctomycetaceae bacterium]
MASVSREVPCGNAAGFKKYLKQDLISGFLVFLIALPLCLGISLACGYPPLAGIFTAIIGSILATFISNSELTIKGPAAGLIVIVIGCVQDFGGDGATGGFTDADMYAYRAALAVGVVAAILQILFGMFRAGILGEFFPIAAVHGMLAAIGIIIILKQFPVALGVQIKGEPLELLGEIPHIVMEANPAIAVIGLVSLSIMILWPWAKKRVTVLSVVPSQLVVLVVAVVLGSAFDLLHEHSYTLQGHKYQLSEQYLVEMPDHIFGMFEELTFPEFSALSQPKAWKWIMMFFIIGSLESVLSAKAVDLIDPWKRKTNMDRDVIAVGVGNLCAAMVGGLPMISEIVRSRANIDNGAKTRFANMWHGVCLLVCVALFPAVLHLIPLAALAAMLVYTGYRLSHPNEFIHVYNIGRAQLIIFITTIVAVLATDLLIGMAIGILVKLIIHILNGVPLKSLFKSYLEVEQQDENTCVIRAYQSAVFSNWIPFRQQIEELGFVRNQNVIIDLSDTKLVDHSVMEKLHEMQLDFEKEGRSLEIIGLETHQAVTGHDTAARRKSLLRFRRLTVTIDREFEPELVGKFISAGASSYSAMPCHGAGKRELSDPSLGRNEHLVRVETIVPHAVCEELLTYLRREVISSHRALICVESIEVIRGDLF